MGTIRNGKYYKDEQPVHDERSTTLENARESHSVARQYEQHAHNLIQPNNPDGTVNQDFIDYYPDDAKNHGFIPESEEL